MICGEMGCGVKKVQPKLLLLFSLHNDAMPGGEKEDVGSVHCRFNLNEELI